ncbi:MAG: hypothetical protein IJ875_02630 [Solobacterium sp.]|nr:hypothetical protein [Solobacterium sp.]
MRKRININQDWCFHLEDKQEKEIICLPHTWNAIDGQDGDGQYKRGKGIYEKEIDISLEENQCVFIEIEGAAMVTDVYLNNQHVGYHEGGYSTFRFDLTPFVKEGKNKLIVEVDNCKKHVYPQMADFTFYGGLYRDVHLIYVNKNHFDLLHFGSPGVKVTPIVEGDKASVTVETWQTNGEVEIEIDGQKKRRKSEEGKAEFTFEIEHVHLWHGKEDPYLYSLKARLFEEEKCVDEIEIDFGCRTFSIDAERGFLLNGKEYPLRGVSRHQDRKGIGNALTNKEHEEDFQLIYEMGSNSIRLAHYQHAQYFYDLCDRYGIVVWAEIPYISQHIEEGNENTLSQMKELVIQNAHHPSVVVWGLSNEITMQQDTPALLENHKRLNELVYSLDPTRKTVVANIGTVPFHHPILSIPDVVTYNVYFGWYSGVLEDNDVFFDKFHKENPTIPVGFSEYGCDTNIAYHSSSPTRGDYTEEYQCLYHEHILKLIASRPWLWCSYAWNMFDFAADARNEGGAKGINQKGIVSFDRKIKKDVYYLYQAYWTNNPFVHLCGKRYVDRNETTTKIKVYSNLNEVELFVDGEYKEKKAIDKVVEFEIEIKQDHHVEIRSGEYKDEMHIRYVEKPNEAYILKGAGIMNWFDAEGFKEDYYSLKDKAACLLEKEEMKTLLDRMLNNIVEGDGIDLIRAREDRNYISTLTDITIEDFLCESGNPISNNIKRHINNMLQQIKK